MNELQKNKFSLNLNLFVERTMWKFVFAVILIVHHATAHHCTIKDRDGNELCCPGFSKDDKK